jgi:hypothetical protein
MDLEEIVYECVDWILQAKDRGQWQALVCTVMNIVSTKAGNFLTPWATISFPGKILLRVGSSFVPFAEHSFYQLLFVLVKRGLCCSVLLKDKQWTILYAFNDALLTT